MIERTTLVEMFQLVESQGLSTKQELLWGYFFIDKDPDKLKAMVPELAERGYIFVDIYEPGEGPGEEDEDEECDEHDHDCGHEHSHEHEHEHKAAGCDEHHGHSHKHKCGLEHSHEHKHDCSHEHEHEHKHQHCDHEDDDEEDEYFCLHVEKPEQHTVDSLDARNKEFAALATKYGIEGYDGMDVGPVDGGALGEDHEHGDGCNH